MRVARLVEVAMMAAGLMVPAVASATTPPPADTTPPVVEPAPTDPPTTTSTTATTEPEQTTTTTTTTSTTTEPEQPTTTTTSPEPTTTTTMPAHSGCDRVAMVGDSMTTWIGGQSLRDRFAGAGVPFVLDGKVGRSVPAGIRAVRSIRARFGDADCWIVALGTNDALNQQRVRRATRRASFEWRVRAMLAEIGEGHRVWWVNVATKRAVLRPSFADFNAALSAAGVPTVDHAGLMAAGGWAGDGVHLSSAALRRRAALIFGSAKP